MKRLVVLSVFILVLAATGWSIEVVDPRVVSERHPFRLVRVTGDLTNPWGMAFLPDGRILVTERPGRMAIVDPSGGDPVRVSGVPAVAAGGQGGLLDVVLHPDFSRNNLVYFSHSAAGSGGTGTAVTRARLSGTRLSEVETIFTMNQMSRGPVHFGSRLLFLPDGTLLVTIGDRGQMQRSQDQSDHAGSTIRINDDGSVPADNPFVGQSGIAPEIFTWGNRNAQGMTLQPGANRVWQSEHGPRGGDELNLIEAGANYGWPVVSYGRDYRTGEQIGQAAPRPGMVDPVETWSPAVAPGGIAFYTGDRFPGWSDNLFVASLVQRKLIRLELDGTRVRHQEELLVNRIGRIRDVASGPDGYLYLLTDESRGGVYRLEPN